MDTNASKQNGVLSDSEDRRRPEWFRTTQWTDLLQAKNTLESSLARAGLSRICENYWKPIYTYLRRCGHSQTDAEDLTQGFFEHLLSRDWLKNVQPGNGKFRSFLLKSLKNFCLNVREKALAEKRGGKEIIIPLNEIAQEEEHVVRAPESLTPEQDFDRRWAESLMERAISRLQHEYQEGGKAELYHALKDIQPGECGAITYKEIGERLNLSEAAIKNAVLRMRARLANILRTEIRTTVDTATEVDEELRYLREALSR